ncbi:MAG: hypothetical protein MJ252_06855 [archaeon]|nr:hypothetical protein [archaeon]
MTSYGIFLMILYFFKVQIKTGNYNEKDLESKNFDEIGKYFYEFIKYYGESFENQTQKVLVEDSNLEQEARNPYVNILI